MKQIDLNDQIWSVANILRGKMDASDYKNYILGFIFFKFLSEKIELRIKNDILDEGDKFLTNRDFFESLSTVRQNEYRKWSIETIGYFIEPKDSFSSIIADINDNKEIIEKLEESFLAIEKGTIGEKSSQDFQGLFDDIDLYSKKLGDSNKERNKIVSHILLKISEIDANNDHDLLGNAYEFLISQFASSAGKKGGEFYTPKEVSTLIAKLVTYNRTKLNSIYDPTCGSGSLLIKALNATKHRNAIKVYGQELNHTTFNLARMNMFLNDIRWDNFLLRQGDTIKNDKFPTLKADVIVANPPFGTKWEASENYLNDYRFQKYGVLAPASKAEYTFLQHMLYHLADDGIIATVMPHGVLFRGGAELQIRKQIVGVDNYLDAVIGLPKNLFFGTSIPAVILVFNKCRVKDQGILFIDGSQEFGKNKNKNFLRPTDIEKIITCYGKQQEIPGFSTIVPITNIKANDFNLNINRYLNPIIDEEIVSLSALNLKLKTIKTEQNRLRELINRDLEALGLEKLD